MPHLVPLLQYCRVVLMRIPIPIRVLAVSVQVRLPAASLPVHPPLLIQPPQTTESSLSLVLHLPLSTPSWNTVIQTLLKLIRQFTKILLLQAKLCHSFPITPRVLNMGVSSRTNSNHSIQLHLQKPISKLSLQLHKIVGVVMSE